jgi:hypothetical protein
MNLWYGHLVAAVLHAAQFAIALNFVVNGSEGLVVQITNPPGESFSLTVKWLVPFFSALSVCNHALYLCGFRQHWIKWAEYSISAGLMFALVSILSGLLDLRALILMVGANFGLQFMVYDSERGRVGYDLLGPATTGDRPPLIAGFVVWGFMSAGILVAYITTVLYHSDVPVMVHVIVSFITLAMASFGVVATLRVSTIQREWYYIFLSIVSKTFLSNSVLFGSLR